MKNILIFIFVSLFAQLAGGLSDYEEEFGFPLDKPQHGKYYFMKELHSIDRDPQIMLYNPDSLLNRQELLLEQSVPTDLDRIELSDSTLVLDVNALNDLDIFSSLDLKESLEEYEKLNTYSIEYSFTQVQPADYNLYTRMELPVLLPKDEPKIEFFPQTEMSIKAAENIKPIIEDFLYQIDNLFLKENNIIPQYGKIDFIITIGNNGVEDVDYELSPGSGFSNSFIRKAADLIKNWQLTSPVKIRYIITRSYLNRY